MLFKTLPLLCALILCGCHQASRSTARHDFEIVRLVRVPISAEGDSIKFSPALRLTNMTNLVIGLVHFGHQITVAKLDYRLIDEHQKEVPLLRRDFMGSTLAGTRIWTTLLLPGKSVEWTPDEALVFAKVPKGRYWLVSHIELDPPNSIAEIGLSDGEIGQIDHKRRVFDSAPLAVDVE